MMHYPTDYSPLRPGGLTLTRQLLALGGSVHGCRVLDLGCGRGETAALLAREYGAAVTGVDISPQMIENCHTAYPEIPFLTADAQSLPFADDSFDTVVCECCFSVFPDPEKAFREVNRVLVPGGKLLLSDLWQRGDLPAGCGIVRNLYSKEAWLKMSADGGVTVTDFIDASDAMTELYIQMILDLGLEEAQRTLGLCLRQEDMKKVSYMLLAGTNHMHER